MDGTYQVLARIFCTVVKFLLSGVSFFARPYTNCLKTQFTCQVVKHSLRDEYWDTYAFLKNFTGIHCFFRLKT